MVGVHKLGDIGIRNWLDKKLDKILMLVKKKKANIDHPIITPLIKWFHEQIWQFLL